MVIELSPREDRKPPSEIVAEFDARSGELLGALLELAAVATVPAAGEIPVNHRLHDFCLFGQRIFIALGQPPEKFMRLVDLMRRRTGSEIASSDDFVVAVREVLGEAAENAQAGDGLPG